MPESVALSHLGQQEWDVRHALHATDNHDFPAVQTDGGAAEIDALQTRPTGLVHCVCWRTLRHARPDRDLTRRVWARAELACLSKNQLLDVGCFDPSGLEHPADHGSPQIDCGERRESPEELANRGAASSDNDNFWHGAQILGGARIVAQSGDQKVASIAEGSGWQNSPDPSVSSPKPASVV